MAERPPLRDYSRSRAVVMGTWTYSFLGDVPAAKYSMQRMAGLLAGPLCGWPLDRLLLVEDEPSPGDLPDQLITAFDGITDVALFYFVGHGQISYDDELCLGLGQSRPEANRRASTSLKFSDVRTALQGSDAAVKIVILDCCFAGLATKPTLAGGRADNHVLDLITSGTGAYTMAATSAYATAWYETDPRLDCPQTYFTKYLADLVEAGIPGQPTWLRLDPLFEQLRDNLAADRRPVPGRRGVNEAGKFEFARNAAPPDPELVRQVKETGDQLKVLQALAAERARELTRLKEQLASTGPGSTTKQYQLQAAIDGAARQLNDTQVAIAANADQIADTRTLDFPDSVSAAQSGRQRGLSAPAGSVTRQKPPRKSRRVRVAAAIVVSVAVLLAVVLFVVLVVVPGGRTPRTGPTRLASSSTPSASPVDCVSGTLTLTGSSAFGPIANAEADAYMSKCKTENPKIAVEYGNGIDSASGVSTVENDVINGKGASEIGMYDGTTSTLDKQEPLPAVPIGIVIFSVIAHVGAISAPSISTHQLIQLFTEGGLPGKLGVGFQKGSASRLALFDLIQQPASTFPNACPPPSGSAGCYESSYANELTFMEATPNTIGYMAVDNAGGHLVGYPNISVLSIGPYGPTPENVSDGSYDFTEVEHLYTSPQPSALAKAFIQYLQQSLTRYVTQDKPSDFLACSSAPKRLVLQCPIPH